MATNPPTLLLPSAEAIDILNKNAAAAAKRSRFAMLAQDQQRIGRDALRRDYAPRTPATTDLLTTAPVPPDAAPASPDLPNQQLQDLVNQFQGTGGTGGGGGFIGGGGGGTSGGSGGSSGTGSGGGGGTPAGGVQTFHGDPGATNIGQAWPPAGFHPISYGALPPSAGSTPPSVPAGYENPVFHLTSAGTGQWWAHQIGTGQ